VTTTGLLNGYLLKDGVSRVAGWLDPGAASAIVCIDRFQRRHGIEGDAAEIGVHHGKLFILLSNLRRPGERAFAFDVFEDQHLNPDTSGEGNRAIFEENLRNHGDPKRVEIMKRDSLTLSVAAFRADPGFRGIRLFSVDGSHTAKHTFSDLSFASGVLASGGVIFLDDFYNPDWPGVQEGFYRFLQTALAEFAPFAYGCNKLLLTDRAHHQRYYDYFRTALRPFFTRYKEVEIGKWSAIHFELGEPETLFDDTFELREQDNSMGLHCYPLSGWGSAEPGGSWTDGDIAELRIERDESPSDRDWRVDISAKPFLHADRSSRRLEILCDGESLTSIEMTREESHSFSVIIPGRLTANPLDLVFLVESPESPADIIGSDDRRKLGFFISSIRVFTDE
jgi:hypothetical protein